MDTIVKHAGISTLTLIGASALTAAAIVNPVGAAVFMGGFIWWLHERTTR